MARIAPPTQQRECLQHGGMAGGHLDGVGVPRAAGVAVGDELDVADGQHRRAQRGDHLDRRRRVVDRDEHAQQVAHFAGVVQQCAALDHVGDAGPSERGFEVGEVGAGAHEHGDVA